MPTYGFALYVLLHISMSNASPYVHVHSVAAFNGRRDCEIARSKKPDYGLQYRCWSPIADAMPPKIKTCGANGSVDMDPNPADSPPHCN